MNKIYLVGTIDEDLYRQFSEELGVFEARAARNKYSDVVVEVEMNSGGGTAMDAIAFYGRIKRSHCSIKVTAYGFIASAAVLVFAACDHRRMTKESWMMVHEDSDQLKHASTTRFVRHAGNMRRLEDQWSELLSSCTTTTKDVWLDLHEKETYLTADECKTLGIVDEVI